MRKNRHICGLKKQNANEPFKRDAKIHNLSDAERQENTNGNRQGYRSVASHRQQGTEPKRRLVGKVLPRDGADIRRYGEGKKPPWAKEVGREDGVVHPSEDGTIPVVRGFLFPPQTEYNLLDLPDLCRAQRG